MDTKDLKRYANKLMIDLSEEEYLLLKDEFDVLLAQMDKIGRIKDIKDIEPMFYPFENDYELREDKEENIINTNDVLANARKVIDNQVCVPKVVSE